MKRLIVEPPGKISKLSAIPGDGRKVAASVGPIRDLPEKDIGVAAPDFRPAYELTGRGRGVDALAEGGAVYRTTVVQAHGVLTAELGALTADIPLGTKTLVASSACPSCKTSLPNEGGKPDFGAHRRPAPAPTA